jgi:hypothetical protein
MTEYLILSLNRALPLVWEYNRQITFNLTFSRTYGSIPKSVLARTITTSAGGWSGFPIDSTAKRIFRAFTTPPQPSVAGVTRISRPRLYRTGFRLGNWTGNPQFRIDLHYANSDGTPGQYIMSFTPSVVDHGSGFRSVYVDFGLPGAFTSGPELAWNTLYSVVLVPTMADASNRAEPLARSPTGDTLGMVRIGRSSDNGATWTLSDGVDWDHYNSSLGFITIGIAFYYESEVMIPVAKSSEAFRSYFNGWVSRTTPPSGFNYQDIINGVTNPATGTEVRFTDSYTHLIRFWTTAGVAGFTQTDVASFKWQYDINPVTIDMFYASEAYLQRIDFLGSSSTTSSVRLNDSYEQEFSGAGGTSIIFDPPILWWKAQVLSGAVRLRALVFE